MASNLFNTNFLVIGFKNKGEYATLNKEFTTEQEAMTYIDGIKQEYYDIVLRKEESFIGNNEKTDISISTPIYSIRRNNNEKNL